MPFLWPVVGAVVFALAIAGYALIALNVLERVRSLWRRYILKQHDPVPATKEDVAQLGQRVDGLLEELKQSSVAPPPATAPVDSKALAAAATSRTEQLLTEAVELQRQHRERDAIERLLTAYDMDMPPEAKSELHILAGNGFLRLSELEQAEAHYRQALDAAEKAEDKERQAAALGNLGIVHRQRGQLNKAEHHFTRALAIDEEIGDRLGQANALGNLGNVYSDRGELGRAEQHYKKALEMDKQIGNRLGQADDLGNLGLVYADRDELDRAEEHHRKALAIDEEISNGLGLGQARHLGNLANVYRLRGELGKAEDHLKRALAIHQQVGNKLGQADTLGNLGLLAAERGQLDSARKLLGQAQAFYKEETGAGGEGPDTVRAALQRLAAASPPRPKPKRKRPRKKP